ncbi:hypothetical protein GJ11_10655 [Escherichia coli]|nr:hypothetical protein GJ11_10655 [Escherichia coli]
MAPVSGERMNDKILRYMQRVVRNSRNPEFMNEVKDACLKKQAFCFEAPDGFLVLRSVLSADGIPYVLVLLGVCTGSNSVERIRRQLVLPTRANYTGRTLQGDIKSRLLLPSLSFSCSFPLSVRTYIRDGSACLPQPPP